MITLQLIERYGPDGWQDEEGSIHYDHEFDSPWGKLGQVSVKKKVDDSWVIQDADGVVLFNRKFCQDLLSGAVEDEHTTTSYSPLGTWTVRIDASNGWVLYQIQDDTVQFSDQEGEVNSYLATLIHQEWV